MTLFHGLLRRLAWRAAPSLDSKRQLLVDISVLHRHDAGTGIQRVVRAIWTQLASTSIDGIAIRPVFATGRQGYRYASPDFLDRDPIDRENGAATVRIGPGDCFLGLDLAAHLLFKHRRQIASWRRAGASFHVVVYDLLPLRNPQWFTPKTGKHFGRWLSVIARQADQAIGISAAVADDLRQWSRYACAKRRSTLKISHFPLSGELAASRPSSGFTAEYKALAKAWTDRDIVLMVGTVEPRKGHDAVIDAFNHIWRTSPQTSPLLIIVGRPGWESGLLHQQLEQLSAVQDRLIWFRDLSDEALDDLYGQAALVLAASRGEGFGLPIAEALWHGRKVLARDLAVFRELETPGLRFFSSDAPDLLAADILDAIADPQFPQVDTKPWSECADILLAQLGLRRDGRSDAA